MSDLKHTPGKWRYEKGSEDHYPGQHFVVWEGTECDATTVCEANYGENDARLISAAPEMLECLISIQEGKQPYENESGFIKISLQNFPNIKKIIEKATGQKIEDLIK